MTILFRFASLFAVGCALSMPALASNTLPGTYLDPPGGNMSIKPILFENVHVDKQLDNQKDRIKLVSPGSPTRDIEIVFMRMGDNALPVYLKMVRKNDTIHTIKSIDCDELTRK